MMPTTTRNYLLVMLAAALTPALASYIGRKGGCAFVLTGESTSGKTLALRTCASIGGGPGEDDLLSLNMTDGKAVELLTERGATCLCFGDPKASQAKSRDFVDMLQTLSFSTADGSQRSTLLKPQAKAHEYLMAFLSAERPVGELFADARKSFEAGDALRIIDIPVPSPAEGGIFDRPPVGLKSVKLAHQTEEAIGQHYGRALFRLGPAAIGNK
jgi:hypothetical protein